MFFDSIGLSKKESIAFSSIAFFVLISLICQTYNNTFAPVIVKVMAGVSIMFGLFGVLYYFFTSKPLSPTKSVLLMMLYLLLVGIINGVIMTWGVLDSDIRSVLFIICAAILGSSPNGMRYFHNLMKILGVLSIIWGVLGVLSFFGGGYSIETREGTWTLSYFYWWASCATFCYWGYYSLLEGKDRLIGYGVLLAYFVLGMLFLKRAALINVVVLMFVYVIINKKHRLSNTLILISSLIVIILVLQHYFPNMYYSIEAALTNRFQSIQDTGDVDRTREASMYLKRASYLQILFGNGVGHHVPAPLWEGDTILSLHIGWYNFIFKGGVPYFFFLLILFVKIIFNYINKKYCTKQMLVCFGVSVSFLISLFYEGGWGNTIITFCVYTPIFYAYKGFLHSDNARNKV